MVEGKKQAKAIRSNSSNGRKARVGGTKNAGKQCDRENENTETSEYMNDTEKMTSPGGKTRA